jgi:Carboxypeptidase regulatory-like domain/TonB-dependent Receptor Plug Domain
MRSVTLIVGAFVFAMVCSLVSIGQTTLGVVAGTVTDSTGAVVVGATVSAERIEGGEPKVAITGPTGEYRVESLMPGTYRVKVAAANFPTTEVSNVTVNPSVTTPVNVKMSVGKASETVEVDASIQQIQTESGQLDNVIPSVQVRDLPIAGGNPYSLAMTLPGVSQPDQRDNLTNGAGFSVDGLRPRANNFLIDGFDNNDFGIGGQALQPSNQESVASVTILQNAYAPEFGRGGGSVSNLVFKSGTNSVHGALWEQYSGAALSAVTAEEQASGLTSAPHAVNNLFGFTVGGPIVKNKLFFFGTSQWTRDIGVAPFASTLTIPTANGIATLQKLLPNNNVQIMLNSLGGLVAPNATATVPIADEPGCTGCSVEFGVLQRSDSTRGLSYEWTARGDYTPTTSDSVFARFTSVYSSLTPDLFANPSALPSEDTQQGGPSRNLGVFWSHTFGPRVLNEFRFSAQTIAFYFTPTAATLANPQAHLPGISFSSSFGGGVVALGGFEQGTFPQGRQHQIYQFQDAVSVVKGTHNFKMGTDLAVILAQDEIPFNADGLAVYTPSAGDPNNKIGCTVNGQPFQACTDLANYIDDFTGTGPTASLSKVFGNPRVSVPTSQQAYYFEDSWKMRPNFTLDYGVRYEYQPPDAENALAFPGIDRTTALTAPFGTRIPVKSYRNAWGPRVGFSYSPRFWESLFGENKTVIRGGAGVFYDSFFTNINNNTAATSPNTLGNNLFPVSGRGIPQSLSTLAAITPVPNPQSTEDSVVDNLRNPRTYQWNLNVQRELPGRLLAQVAYVGTRGEGLFDNEQFNPRIYAGSPFVVGARVNPNLGSIVVRANRGDSIYHGLQAEVTRSVGRLSLRAAYTWSRAIDNGSEVFTTTGGSSFWQNVLDPRSDRGPSAFNHTNVAAFTWVYALPGPSSHFLNEVFGGWETSGSIVLQSGAPETLYFGGLDVNGDGQGNDRPSVLTANAPINVSPACLNNPTCVTGIAINDPADLGPGLFDLEQLFFGINGGQVLPVAANQVRYVANAGQNGNLGRNSINLPGLEQYNMSVLKNFKMPFGESHQLQFRADFLNAFNHFNAGQNNIVGYGNLLNPGFGVLGPKSLTLDGGRSIQIWLKYSF